MQRILILSILMTLLGAPFALAEEEDDGFIPGEFSGNARIISDYVFRGVSQTVDESAAIQGGIDWSHDSGFYLGTWASSVDFGGDAYFENDIYGGFGTEVAGIGVDVSAWYFLYAEDSDLNYWEFALGLSHDLTDDLGMSLGVIVSPDYFNAFGTGVVVNLGTSYAIPCEGPIGLSIDGLIEYTKTEDDGVLGTDDDYFDWNVGLGLSYDIVSIDLRYHGTDETDGPGDHRFVFGVGVAFP